MRRTAILMLWATVALLNPGPGTTAPQDGAHDGGTSMERVTGVGGVFLKAADPVALRAWYQEHLGIDVQDWGGTAFLWADDAADGMTVWSVGDGANFAPSDAPFMINYRVDDLRAMMQRLRDEGCQVVDDVQESEFGAFGWVLDPEGNKIELWQSPVDDAPAAAPATTYGLIGQMTATPGHRDELIAILLEGTTAMPGCLSYVIAKDPENADALWITEVWVDREHHAASLQLPSVQAAIARGKALIAGFGVRHETEPVGRPGR